MLVAAVFKIMPWTGFVKSTTNRYVRKIRVRKAKTSSRTNEV